MSTLGNHSRVFAFYFALNHRESFEQDGKTYDYLQELAIRELEHRHQQRIARLLKQAKLSR
jgi:hypothetical protein